MIYYILMYKGSWAVIDTGLVVRPRSYTLRHARGYSRSALRSWVFQGSKDNTEWFALSTHTNDESLTDAGTTHTWHLEPHAEEPFRFFRILMTGPGADSSHNYLSLSGFELYGTVVDVVEDDVFVKVALDEARRARREREYAKQQKRLITIGVRVVRGPDWKWNKQDGDPPGLLY